MKVASTTRGLRPLAYKTARCAVRALYAEVALEPKPGLVSFRDNGSHADMSAHTFFKSLFALRHYFGAIAIAGQQGAPFETLQSLGLDAEARMLRATGGVNTHRGAIFSLGLLCAGAGQLQARAMPVSAVNLRTALLLQWGDALRQRALAARQKMPTSNGQRAAQSFALRSANDEAAEGFPTLFEVTLPALQTAVAQGHPMRSAKVHSLFCTMAHLDDTNVVHRGGLEGMQLVKTRATQFLARGSVAQADWLAQARRIHEELVARRLSPGGAADLIACACWVDAMQTSEQERSVPVATGREQVHG
ncbi:triphosphoribosyl-dephospho-CoA synthase MdcB [Rhodoferax sp. GW822-FHT02A01]|uniref:triphosphoribosyl-dephospho-CoA synthase MdcB n=1 Tax=Rhodoferax sp. GW822-FHT02A01 TaxID=3141537 RepID=UPI00315DFF2B